MSEPSVDIEDAGSLRAYLRDSGRVGGDEALEIRTLAGGVSNKTVWVRRPSGEAWVLKQALPKLRTKADWFSDPARIRREALGLEWLPKLAPAGTITPLIFRDDAEHLLAMEAVPEPHENWKTMLLAGRVEPDHVGQFGTLLGAIHRSAHERREQLQELFDERGFFESLRLEPYFAYTSEQVPAARRFLHELIEQTRARRFTLVHGDYSPKNVLVREGRLVLLDHEVIHWGDGAFDHGFALAHFLSKAHHLVAHRDAFVPAAILFWQRYREAVGDVPWLADLEPAAVRSGLGCLLARVAGRSPLEYLSPAARERQERVVVQLMHNPPATVEQLASRFVQEIERCP
jgi:5-methylthioribose kinase